MAFQVYKTVAGHVIPWEYLPCSAIQPKAGMAMVLSSGKLAKCGATAAPTYISMYEAPAAVSAGTIIPVIRVDHDTIFEVQNQAQMTAAIGAKVTLHTDGLQVTNTTTSGVAEIVDYDAAAAAGAGGKVHVRF